MKRKIVAFTAILILANSCFAFPQVFPAPSINGPTGLIRIPSADVIPYKNFSVAADYGTRAVSGSSESEFYYKMNLGTFHGTEVGIVGGADQSGQRPREGVYVNLKLALSTGEDAYPLLLAIGTENLFSYNKADVYMVATKYLKQGPKLTFGFMADFPNNKFRPSGMLGAEFALSDAFILAADGMLGETLSQVNAGARFYFTPIFSVNLSGINLLDDSSNPRGKDPKAYLIGINWANPF